MENKEETYEQWKARMASKSDSEVSDEIRKMILEKSGIDDASKKVFNLIYDYFAERAKDGRPVKIDLLKVHLQELHGYDPKQIDMPTMLILLNLCGINTGQMIAKENSEK